MDVNSGKRLDVTILLGIINEKLRLECDGLERAAGLLRHDGGSTGQIRLQIVITTTP